VSEIIWMIIIFWCLALGYFIGLKRGYDYAKYPERDLLIESSGEKEASE
jgi:hypothetical protein